MLFFLPTLKQGFLTLPADCFNSWRSCLSRAGCSSFSCSGIKETADIHFVHKWSVSLSVGQDYSQSNPELRRKQGQSSVWSSHHLCACPGYWAGLCFTPWINPTWGLNDLALNIKQILWTHVVFDSQSSWTAKDSTQICIKKHIKAVLQRLTPSG